MPTARDADLRRECPDKVKAIEMVDESEFE